MANQKKWVLLNKKNSADEIKDLSRRYNIPPIVASILLNRGITDIGEFLAPSTDNLLDPFLMLGMKEACELILETVNKNEKITVYGDYDVDGITSTAILVSFLRKHGADCDYYIPDRREEGYGINVSAIEKIASSGTKLIITVDCGITATNEIKKAKELGMEVIVTDHHECKDELPKASVILNPKQPGCGYPFKKLAGVGVVFKLLVALTTRLKYHLKQLYDEYLDLVAIGTIADVMPLVGENRIIVKRGLALIPYTVNKGVKAIIDASDTDTGHITTNTVGFIIAPKINAAGRVGDPKCAVELLLATDDVTARNYAEILTEENHQRQETEMCILDDALSLIENDKSFKNDYVLVLSRDGWHHGIIGIVASKISEKFSKPTILISTENGVGKGSGRSIKGLNLFHALENSSSLLLKYGGHELAAGLSVASENIALFRKNINDYAKNVLTKEDFIPIIDIDCELPLKYVNLSTIERMTVLEPYGMNNPCPVFYARNLFIASQRLLKDGKHIKLTLSDGFNYVDAIGFNMGYFAKEISHGDTIDIVFSLSINEYRGEKQAQIVLKDIRKSNIKEEKLKTAK